MSQKGTAFEISKYLNREDLSLTTNLITKLEKPLGNTLMNRGETPQTEDGKQKPNRHGRLVNLNPTKHQQLQLFTELGG